MIERINTDPFTGAHILLERGFSNKDEIRFMVQNSAGEWQGINWGDYLEKTKKITLYLSDLDINKDKKVSIYAKTRVEWAYSGLGIQACRGVFVPVYYSNTVPQTRYIVNHSDSEVLITELDLLGNILKIWDEMPAVKKVIVLDSLTEDVLLNELERLIEYSGRSLNLSAIKERIDLLGNVFEIGESLIKKEDGKFEYLIKQIDINDISSIFYTSGTTGDPKGVVLTNYNLYTNAEDWIDVLGSLIPKKMIDLLWLPTSHIFGWGELGLGNTLGFKTYFTNPLDVLDIMPEVCPTIFMSVPAYWEKLYLEAKASSDKKDRQLDRLNELTGGELRFCLSGGAGLKREVKEFFYEAGMLIIEGYGLTECSPTLTMNRKDDFDFNTVGKPFPRVELKLPPDGEILAKGPNVFNGYYKNPMATKDAFDSEGWFRTGDLGEWNESGFLKITGRKKEIIVTSGGKNISPQLIEARFKDDPYIEHMIVYGNEKKYLTALLTLREEAIKSYAEHTDLSYENYGDLIKKLEILSLVQNTIDKVNSELASFETIKKFFIYKGHLNVDEGHLTPSLKLKRGKVYEIFGDRFDKLYEE